MVELLGKVVALPVKLLEVCFALAKAIIEAAEGVFEGRNSTERVVTDVCVVGVSAVDGDVGPGVEALKRDWEATDGANGLGGLKGLQRGGEEYERAAGFGAVGERLLLHSHREVVATGARPRAQVFPDARDVPLGDLRALGEVLDAVAHLILTIGVLLFEPSEPQNLGVDGGLFDDKRIAGSDGFYLGVGESSGIHVFGAAHGRVAGHDLGDEPAFRLQCLPHVGVETAFGDVAEDLHVFVGIALAQDASVALLDVCGTPRCVEVVQGHESALHIRAFAHLWRAAEKDAHLPFAHGLEERGFGGVFVIVLDKCDLAGRNTAGDQLFADVVINREPFAAGLWRGEIAEDELGAFQLSRVEPDLVDLSDGEVHLAVWALADAGHHEPQVERCLPAFGRDLEHVVVARIDLAAFDLLNAFNELLDEALQFGRDRCAHSDWPTLVELRNRKLEHVRRLHIRHLPKLLHQLGHIDETREAALQTVACAIRAQRRGGSIDLSFYPRVR